MRRPAHRRDCYQNTAEITDSERVMYRQVIQAVYDDPSLTGAAMYERTRKACEDTVPVLTEH